MPESRRYDWRAEASRIESFGMFLTTLCGSCSAAKDDPPRPNCRQPGGHSLESRDLPTPPDLPRG